jgi:hypothetical protein
VIDRRVKLLEIGCVVRHEQRPVLVTPVNQIDVVRFLAEDILRLYPLVAALTKDTLEDTTDVFVEQHPAHVTRPALSASATTP